MMLRVLISVASQMLLGPWPGGVNNHEISVALPKGSKGDTLNTGTAAFFS